MTTTKTNYDAIIIDILTSDDFKEFDLNHGLYDSAHLNHAITRDAGNGGRVGRMSIYGALRNCAYGSDIGGNGSTYEARKAAAVRCLEKWPMAWSVADRACTSPIYD